MTRPSPAFYRQNTVLVAEQLLGAKMVRQVHDVRMEGYIVETEAYLPVDDPACHAARGRTKRNSVMFGKGGLLYVYSIHSRFCMNIVTEEEDLGAAVLVRAIEPLTGCKQLRMNRELQREGRTKLNGNVVSDIELTNGPGKLCDALGVSLKENGIDLVVSNDIWIEEGVSVPRSNISTSGRIGIRQGTELPLRFFVDGNVYVSGKASLHRQKRNRTLQ